VRVVLAGGAGVLVDLGGPGAGMPAVVGEGGDRLAESVVARPAEVHGPVRAGFLSPNFRDLGQANPGLTCAYGRDLRFLRAYGFLGGSPALVP